VKHAIQNTATEWSYASGKPYPDPFNDIQLDVIVTAPNGDEQTVPAFWAGEQTWTVRYASPQVGTHRYRTVCSDAGNLDLHGREGTLEVAPYAGDNPLLKHGPLRVAADQRHLEHRDGTPFFWLGDTWWMAFCKRLKWPEDFHELTADRVAKGFTLIQIIAGLYPDMPWHDERGANEAGFPWDKEFTRINPTYFDQVDVRVAHLVRSGLAPCIVGFWGYFLDFAGVGVLKKHWRNLIARYGAYPVVWCAAGEALMPYYRHPDFERMLAATSEGGQWLPDDRRATWSEIMRHIRATDPYHHPLAIHPTRFGHEQADDPSALDIDWLQTGHGGIRSLDNTINMLEEALAHQPKMPVLVSEVNYEGILEGSREEVQRFLFWTCMLSGAMGHTYGANGIWQVNTQAQPFGSSPHGLSWGDRPWDEAYRLPGSGQLGLAKRFFERYPWQRFEPRPEWVEPHHSKDNRLAPYAAGISGEVRVMFIPTEALRMTDADQPIVKDLEPGVKYRAFYFNPSNGVEYEHGVVTGDAQGTYRLPKPPIFRDWVFVLER
jgi:hypothetical protein